MATSVKISRKDKAKLERLQALLTLRGGSKVTQQEILSALIGDAMDRVDELADRVIQASLPMDDEDYSKITSLIEDWGIETSWEDVDRVLYGSKGARERQ